MTNLHRIVWLASYPKSGNTWIRSLMAHYFMPPGQAPDINNLRDFTTGDGRADFFDAAAGGTYAGNTLEEWLELRPKALRLIAASRPNHHFVKTHCQSIRFRDHDLIPSEVTAAAIYILRNPFDVAPSYARHMNTDVDTAIDRMMSPENLMGSPRGIFDVLGRWDDHVTSWTSSPGLSWYAMRYEDLLTRPGPMVRKMLETFLKVPVDKPKLARAIKATSFDSLKKQEEKLGFRERPPKMKAFFAKGRAGVWREDLTGEQVGRLREAFLPTLERWYPEMLADTAAYADGSDQG